MKMLKLLCFSSVLLVILLYVSKYEAEVIIPFETRLKYKNSVKDLFSSHFHMNLSQNTAQKVYALKLNYRDTQNFLVKHRINNKTIYDIRQFMIIKHPNKTHDFLGTDQGIFVSRDNANDFVNKIYAKNDLSMLHSSLGQIIFDFLDIDNKSYLHLRQRYPDDIYSRNGKIRGIILEQYDYEFLGSLFNYALSKIGNPKLANQLTDRPN